MNNLRRLDLNLLVTLDVLLSELNVTRAAQRLNFSQPSVSVHLAKLRDIFNDPLLLPGPRGMYPTARANELREPLRQALESLEHVILPASQFDPATATQTWKIAATDYTESAILLPLLAKLRMVAPNSRLAVIEMEPPRIARQQEKGEIDLAFHTREGAPPSLHCRTLFMEQYVLAGRIGHPRLKAQMTPAQFCALEHVIISPDGGGFYGPTDEILAKTGLTRRVVLSVPHFLFVMSVLTSTDLVAMLPLRLVHNIPTLQLIKPPVDVPGFEMTMVWHKRSHKDPAHQWLREYIANSI